jgi:hypothetical protein
MRFQVGSGPNRKACLIGRFSGWKGRLRQLLFWAAVVFAAVFTGWVYLCYASEVAMESLTVSNIRSGYIPYHYAVYRRVPYDLGKLQEFIILDRLDLISIDVYRPELKDVHFDGTWYHGVIQFHAWPARSVPFSVSMHVIRNNAEHYKKKLLLRKQK